MLRSMASNVSALSSFVAKGHQTSISFPLPPLKFRTVGFPQYGFKRAVSRVLRPFSGVLTRPQWRSLPSAFYSVVGLSPKRHARPLTPHTRPVALGSASGYSVRQPHRLLWPHPSFYPPPPVSGLCRRPCNEQRFPNLLCLSLIPCRRLYSGGSRTRTDESTRLTWPSPILSGLGNHSFHTSGLRVALLTKRQHSRNAAARNLASPAPDRTFTTELACGRSLFHTSVMTT
jgi:hypothetical protein